MRMSAKEKRARAEQAQQGQIRAALRWTDPAPPPDVMPPEGYAELSTGFLFNAHSSRINVACSGAASHARGQTDRTTSQGARRLYSTRLRALQALRNAVEQECAERLARIDAQIAQEEQSR